MFPLSKEEITNLKSDDIELLCKLDSNGFFAKKDENIGDFRLRLQQAYDITEEFAEEINSDNPINIFDDITVEKQDLIGSDIILEAMEKTKELYDFQIDYIPGFFLSKDIGLLWGGCSIYDEETSQRIFIIRKAFKSKRRWFCYERSELLAHELCHGARQILMDNTLEEYFAYQTSASKLRRYMGNYFISDFDAILFVMPSILLLISQLVKTYIFSGMLIWPFWLILLGVLLFFYIRNKIARNIISCASKKLLDWKISKQTAFLFRCTSSELKEINQLNSLVDFREYINRKAKGDLRFKVILKKWNINDDIDS